uniref:PIN domain-containing protein n=1 Tax=Acrobeloides nanus TaxID=290746 RepID=A0A914EAA9_9BILA
MAFKKTASLDDLVIITAFSYNHISEAEEYDLILYVDTSVLFKNVNGSSIKDLITVANTPKYELGTILLSRTGHSIKAATNPKMYKYLPINDTLVILVWIKYLFGDYPKGNMQIATDLINLL